MLRTAFVILSGNAATSLLLLVRNLVIARLISVEDYGIAATFGIVMALIEMASYLGMQQQIVQSKDGEDTRFQAALQGFQVLRGAIAAVVLFVSAGLISDFLGIPEVAWAYQVIALVPLLNAFQHFDIHRMNRKMRFKPLILTGLVPALVSLLAIWPLYLWFGDYRVMLWSMMLQLCIGLVVSHLVAERPYRLVFDPQIMGRSLKFGWPLLVNGILMFAVFQGDKLIVGRVMGMETLAIFAMGMTLTLTPTLVMAKSLQNFFLPQLSAETEAHDSSSNMTFETLAYMTIQASLLNGALMVLATICLAEPLISVVLGAKYAALSHILIWLALMHAVRVAKAGSAVIALSKGNTANSMQANLPRVAAMPMIWWALSQGAPLTVAIWIALAGEVLGYAVSFVLAIRRSGLVPGPLILPVLATCLFLIFATILVKATDLTAIVEIGVLFLAFVVLVWSMNELRNKLCSAIHRRFGRALP